MKTTPLALLFFLTVLTACEVKSPDFIIKGVGVQQALYSLSEIQNGEIERDKDPEKLPHYVQHLSENHTPGFKWDQYWQGVSAQNLYQNLTNEQLTSLFSLNRVSCQAESISAFAHLLLQIAKVSGQKALLVRPTLKNLRASCDVGISDSALKSFVSMFSEKYLTSEEHLKQELALILIDEWLVTQNIRAWRDIVSPLKRAFYREVRQLQYQQKDHQNWKNLLAMEWGIFQSISQPEQDILQLFELKNKMAGLIALLGYEKYVHKQALDWQLVWKNLLATYPKAPENGNVDTLLSLYSVSCQLKDFSAFSATLEQWQMEEQPVRKACLNKIVAQGLGDGPVLTTSPVGAGPPVVSIEDLSSAVLQLKAPSSLMYILFLYEKEKHARSLSDWARLLNAVPEQDWLKTTHFLRERRDQQSLARMFNMTHHIQQGLIPFLGADVFNVLSKEGGNVADMLNLGYSLTHLDHPHTLSAFWRAVQKEIDNPAKLVQPSKGRTKVVSAQQQAPQCDYAKILLLYRYFAEQGREDQLKQNFTFKSCAQFVQTFREQEWERLVFLFKNHKPHMPVNQNTTVPHTKNSTENHLASSVDPTTVKQWYFNLVWWMARVLLLPIDISFFEQHWNDNKVGVGTTDSWLYWNQSMGLSPGQSGIGQMSADEWEQFSGLMIQAFLHHPGLTNREILLFRGMLSQIGFTYPQATNRALCHFFAKPHQHLNIKNYHPRLILELFNLANWQAGDFKNQNSEASKAELGPQCVLPQKRRNALLLFWAYSQFELINPVVLSPKDYAISVNSLADSSITLFKQVMALDNEEDFSYSAQRKRSFRRMSSADYDIQGGYISNSALLFYFSALVFQKLKAVKDTTGAGGEGALSLETALQNYLAKSHTISAFDKEHLKLVQDFYTYDLRQNF